MLNFVIIAVISYLLGSINTAIIVSKAVLGQDIRNFGSGNAGLTNSLRTMGGKKTLLVLFGDILKAMISVTIGMLLGGVLGKLIAGIFVILGHVFPLYFNFKGGKGVLAGATFLLLFDWRIFLVAIAIFIISVSITKWVSLGSVLGAISFPICTYFFYDDMKIVLISAGMSLAVIYMHRSNIKRIFKGEENKISFKNKADMEKK